MRRHRTEAAGMTSRHLSHSSRIASVHHRYGKLLSSILESDQYTPESPMSNSYSKHQPGVAAPQC